ncbi:hemolysin family protein [Nocardioides panacisoli]|uniref:hemolysin family protein n=1 Tax=Nocardioides panacisoli TaxID=627624 RepID=UPI001C62B962|nr:hemolysin family protein [Nocardioides panacisoli]QYJ03267.1 hemolysin family protein [Nocardioides panacisoli]
MTVLMLLVGILAILTIIAANGYFVAQEFAYMSVDRSRLGASADAGDATARRALAITDRTSFMLSGAQLGITVTGLLIGYVAEPLVGSALGELLGGVGVPTAVGVSVGTITALAVSTIVQMIVGELYPKNLAIANAEPMARGLARSTQIYLAAFGWLITVFDHAANALLKLVRIEPVHDVDSTATPQDLEHIVADSRESGDLPEELSMLLDRILDFPDQDVEHAMVPHSQVGTVHSSTTIAEVRERMAVEHTRYPVVDDDGVAVGLVELADLLASDLPDEAPAEQLMREPVLVPTAMALPDALDQLVEARTELACVIDEYGGLAGVLTVEDMAEELIGEVTDEHDHEAPPTVVAEDEHTWVVDGDVPVDEVERAIGHDLPAGDYETITGLLLDVRGDLLEEGEQVEVELPQDPAELAEDEPTPRTLVAEVVAVERHVPSRLRLHLTEQPATADDQEEVD